LTTEDTEDTEWKRLERDAFETGFEDWDVEVDQKSRSEAGEFKIGDDLGRVDRAELVDGFELYEDFVFDNQISAKAAVEGEVFVTDRDFFLGGDGKASISEFKSEALFINRF
jgi:hypothetical protein